MDVMMRHYLRRVGGLLAATFLIAGILLVRDGMTHSTATNSFAIFAGSALTETGMIPLELLWEPSKARVGSLGQAGTWDAGALAGSSLVSTQRRIGVLSRRRWRRRVTDGYTRY